MKILIISQHLFPMQTPRAHRTTELVSELGRQGHKVTVYAVLGKYDYSDYEKEYNVTVKPIPIHFMLHAYNSDNDKKRTLIDKVLGRLLKKLEFPNIEFIYRVPEVLKKDHDYDALITIADPHQIHWGTARYRLKKTYKFPKIWIADCGDPFMMNGSTNGHLNYFAKYEKLFCQQCDFITVPVEEAKQGYYEEFRSKIEVIPQGFQFDLEQITQEPSNETLTFAFAGNFYKDIRNPESFINYLSKQTIDFKFVVYSPYPEMINEYKHILGKKLAIRSALPRLEMIEELKKMDFLVNIENVNSPAQVPSKLIDYAISGRPILSVNPQQLNTSVIKEFFAQNYSNQYLVKNIEQYHISNVAGQFIKLINLKS